MNKDDRSDEERTPFVELARAAIAAIPPAGGVEEVARKLLARWDAYLESDLSQMNAHDILVRYELWNDLRATLNSTSPKGGEV